MTWLNPDENHFFSISDRCKSKLVGADGNGLGLVERSKATGSNLVIDGFGGWFFWLSWQKVWFFGLEYKFWTLVPLFVLSPPN